MIYATSLAQMMIKESTRQRLISHGGGRFPGGGPLPIQCCPCEIPRREEPEWATQSKGHKEVGTCWLVNPSPYLFVKPTGSGENWIKHNTAQLMFQSDFKTKC